MRIGGKQHIRRFSMALLALVVAAGTAQAQEVSRRGSWEIAPFLSGWDDSPEFGPNESEAFVDPEKGVMFGTHFGYHWATGLFLESDIGFVPLETQLADGTRGGLDLLLFGLNLGYDIPLSDDFELFGSVGPGVSQWSPESLDSETNLSLNLGAGARWFLTENFGLRFDAKYRLTPSALEGTTAGLGESFPGESLKAWSFGGGVSIRLGGAKDSDGDGVLDPSDACPNTPEGVRVDATGCPFDTDGDLVVDHMDDCPNTPRGASVDAAGCPSDSDNDGVFDGIDQCPNTPQGADVNASGCPIDSDGDGVFNGIDRCANTPRGTEVDVRGCPIPLPEPEPIVVANVLFEVDSSDLDAAARSTLDRAGRELREQQDVTIELDGHTDSTASEIHNQALSEDRAHAVMNYLISNFGISAERFEVQSFGESNPTSDNGTEDGRRRNRRVEVRVTG